MTTGFQLIISLVFCLAHYGDKERYLIKKLSISRNQKTFGKEELLWVSWPKSSSKIEADLNGDIVREIGLRNGLVDVKVCSIDKNWSGLKFVYRLKDRK